MADISFKQTLGILTGYVAPNSPLKVAEKDLEIDPEEVTTISDYNECTKLRFLISANTIDMAVCLGTVAVGKVLMIKPSTTATGGELQIKITNSNGISQNMIIRDAVWSVLHTTFTGITFTNTSADAIKGVLFVAGD